LSRERLTVFIAVCDFNKKKTNNIKLTQNTKIADEKIIIIFCTCTVKIL